MTKYYLAEQKKSITDYVKGAALYTGSGAVAGVVVSFLLPVGAVSGALGGLGLFFYRQHPTIQLVVHGAARGAGNVVGYLTDKLDKLTRNSLKENMEDYQKICEQEHTKILVLEQLAPPERLLTKIAEEKATLESAVDKDFEELKRELKEKEEKEK